jgi:hypothetical protein
MARHVFFSFHFERDLWRANVVRNSWAVGHRDRYDAGFWDASLWEAVKRQGNAAIKRTIDQGLRNTSVTVVLIGTETAERTWVRYEITQSIARGNGILGIYIHGIRDRQARTARKGPSPFARIPVRGLAGLMTREGLYPCYDWVRNNGHANIGRWVEEAAVRAGRRPLPPRPSPWGWLLVPVLAGAVVLAGALWERGSSS